MKINDIKSLTTVELTSKLSELKTELFNLRFSHATGNLANPMQLHNVKKDIARVKTILKERELTDKKAQA
ncbi:MAG: 50S ribosomal protein L29 [Clostridia bacterium]